MLNTQSCNFSEFNCYINMETLENKWETLPQNVKSILDKYAECENDYESCDNLVKELNAIGWTCEYYLDAEPYDFRRLIKKGHSYTYKEIEEFSLDVGMDEAEYELHDHGRYVIGQNILVLEHKQKDITMTFLLTGTQNNENIYECVYTDLDNQIDFV